MALRIGRSRLLEHINRNGMNQVQFADRLGVSKSFASKVISGDKKLSLVRAKMCADILSCSMDDLYTWEYDDLDKSER